MRRECEVRSASNFRRFKPTSLAETSLLSVAFLKKG
jgi:hypothetical protein